MIKGYPAHFLIMFFVVAARCFGQVPYEWPIVQQELGPRLDSINNKIDSAWHNTSYCTYFAGDLLLANSNRGYQLFTQNPPGPPNTEYEAYVLSQVDTMLMMMDSLGYKAVDITLSYPLLVDSFPNQQVYFDFYKQVYAMARTHGFIIIENCQVSLAAFSGVADPYLDDDIKNFYFQPNGVPDTITTVRYLTTMAQMMQTIIDSLHPDFLTLEMEPQTQQANLFNLISFDADSTLTYVNYFLSHLQNKRNILFGAGAGTWNTLNYFTNYVTTNVDYIDYHLYPINNGCYNPEVFEVDSLAKLHNKQIVIGECWLHKISDSEYVASNTDITYWMGIENERDVFDYFENLDTEFTQSLVDLSQQEGIDLVNFFNTPGEFGYLTYGSQYSSLTPAEIANLGTQYEYQQMFNMQLGPLGLFTKNAIANINCSTTTGVGEPPPAAIVVTVYPNPAMNNLNVACSQPVQQIIIEDLLGQSVMQLTSIGSTQVIDVHSLSAGVYFIRIETVRGEMVRKFVKD